MSVYCILTPILIAGSLSVGDLLDSQGWLPWEWTAFQTPFSALAFFVFFIGSLAEGNRTPFDLPEAESELVSGFNTEYSGFRFAVFFMAEYGNVFLIGLSTTALFLGGPNLPGFLQGNPFLSVAVMMLKTIFIMFVVIWLRWTLPRFRIDQLMDLSWKYLLPCALIAFFGQSVFMLVAHQIPAITQITSIVVFIVFLLIMIKFIGRIRTNYKEQSIPVGLN